MPPNAGIHKENLRQEFGAGRRQNSSSSGNGIEEGNLKKLIFKLTINVEVEFGFWEKKIPDICLAMAKTESEKHFFP